MDEKRTAPQEQCKGCGADNPKGANFCRKCGEKLRQLCDCYIKKEPYNCGQDRCPGYRLFLMERDQSKTQKGLNGGTAVLHDKLSESIAGDGSNDQKGFS